MGKMTEKTFLITLHDDCACDYREYTIAGRQFYCSRTDFKPCGGDLNNRPAWCPLVPLRKPNNDDIKSYKETK